MPQLALAHNLTAPEYRMMGKPVSPLTRILLWIYLFSFAFDFNGPEGGSAIQYVFLLACIGSMLGLVLLGLINKRSPVAPGSRNIALYWWFYIFVTSLVFVVETLTNVSDATFDQFLRSGTPYLLCGFSLIVVLSLQAQGISPREFLTPLVLCWIVSSITRFFYAAGSAKATQTIADLRFALQSPATWFEVSYGISALLINRRIAPLPLIAFLISFIGIVLSSTRSYFITMASCIAVILYLIRLDPKINALVYVKRILQVIMALGLIAAVAIAVLLLLPDVTDKWTARFQLVNTVGASADPSYLMRLAEVRGEWNAVCTDPVYLLFGKSWGGVYYWDQSYISQIEPFADYSYKPERLGADSTWPTALLYSGILFGPLQLWFLLLPLWKSFGLAKKLVTLTQPQERELIVLPLVGLIGCLSQTITSEPFFERFSALNVGIVVGLTYWLAHVMSPVRAEKKQDVQENG